MLKLIRVRKEHEEERKSVEGESETSAAKLGVIDETSRRLIKAQRNVKPRYNKILRNIDSSWRGVVRTGTGMTRWDSGT